MNNFNLKSRSMKKAGEFALKNASLYGYISYSTAATISHRWSRFIKWLKENNCEVKKLEMICFDVVVDYGKDLALMVEEREMSPSTAQNYVSAINSVMDIATQGRWKSISPTRDCCIEQRSFVRVRVPASLSREIYDHGLQHIFNEIGNRASSIVELCRELGLRAKEASLFDAQYGGMEMNRSSHVTIIRGTKGGRSRILPINSLRQEEAIKKAASIQGKDKSLIPSNRSWREWREGELRVIREAVQKHLCASGLHDLRAAYACDRYEEISGFKTHLLGGPSPGRDIDKTARQQIAVELGHSRAAITNSYLGGRK